MDGIFASLSAMLNARFLLPLSLSSMFEECVLFFYALLFRQSLTVDFWLAYFFYEVCKENISDFCLRLSAEECFSHAYFK